MKGLKGSKIFEILGRKRIIILFIILIILLSLVSISFVVKAVKDNSNKEKAITYTEKSLVDYNVYLKENDFYEKEYLDENKQYIASLIDYINANLKYELNSSEDSKNFEYTYKIIAETNVEDATNKNSIYRISEDLVKEKTLALNNVSKLIINENIKINYNKYNDIINRFINIYNLSNINSTLTINMYVKVEGITKNINTPVASLIIPLTEKTVAIDIESNQVNATETTNVYKTIANKNHLYIAILTFTLTAMIGIELYIFVNDTKDEKTIYKMKIKKILLNYDSYIQKIDNDFNYDGYQQLEMKSFEDLLQVRDTISEPILMVETIKERETEFIIPTKGQVVYIHKLKVEDTNKKKKYNSTKEEIKV